MRKDDLAKIIIKHGSRMKIGWAIIAIMSMIIAIKTYINYSTIKDAIVEVEYDIDNENEKIAYSNSFLKPYLDSEYADYFQGHKNNILFYWEYIIRFESAKEEKTQDDKEIKDDNIIDSPQKSWIHFIKSKLN